MYPIFFGISRQDVKQLCIVYVEHILKTFRRSHAMFFGYRFIHRSKNLVNSKVTKLACCALLMHIAIVVFLSGLYHCTIHNAWGIVTFLVILIIHRCFIDRNPLYHRVVVLKLQRYRSEIISKGTVLFTLSRSDVIACFVASV